MEFIEAIIEYVDAKINYEFAASDPGAGEYFSLNDERKQMEAAREQLLAFTESEELRVLRAFYNFVKLANENPDDDSYAWLTAAIGIAEKALGLGQALDEIAEEVAEEMYEEGEQRASRKGPRGFLSSEDIAALTEANTAL